MQQKYLIHFDDDDAFFGTIFYFIFNHWWPQTLNEYLFE